LNRELIAQSGLFDKEAYIRQAGLEATQDPIGHYLLKGWCIGLEPNASFPGKLLQPYFSTAGFDGPPAITWLIQRSARWPIPTTWSDAQWQAMKIRATGLFDEAFYAAQLGKAASGLDLAIHYVTVGERMGIAPSLDFDAAFYMDCYPDVAQSGSNCLLHYFEHGRREERVAVAAACRTGRITSDSRKDNVILVVHETSRTGAPVLGWNMLRHLARRYNVYTVCMADGELTREFEALSVEVHGPILGVNRRSPAYVGHSLRTLFDSCEFRYAIVNSVESRQILECCSRRFIPTLLLMHEFASSVQPLTSLYWAFDWATEVIFPARVVAQSSQDKCPALGCRRTHILPQGPSELPARESSDEDLPNPALEELRYKHETEGAFIVLGAGGVQIRKGVDLFLAAAATVIRRRPHRAIHFLWVGRGYRPEEDIGYSAFLHEQLTRSGLASHVTFLDAVPNLNPIYRIADAFLLPSRLDPFPNVAMDAIALGIPLICFKEASGTAELLLTDPETATGVVDYLDAEAAGQIILKLAGDKPFCERMAGATRRLAQTSFLDMGTYVSRLDAIGTAAATQMIQRSADAETLINDATFDQEMFLGLNPIVETRAETITRYLTMASARGPFFKEVRRPTPGFHRELYAAEHATNLAGGVDPLADFVRKGKPPGTWLLPVLRPEDPDGQISTSGNLDVALHAHFYYPELAIEFLTHLEKNRTRCDLLISTDNANKATQIERTLTKYACGKVDVRVVPNRGRDMGPLLTEFSDDLGRYDVIGHVHAKRSLIVGDLTIGENWRQFLWQNLLGGRHTMVDRIITAFERQERLGLVFPSDPHVISWDSNRVVASELAGRMGWKGALPDHFDFPLGAMFWIRRDALRPLLDLHFEWSDYPDEPVPYDGTMLHAIERLMPMVCHLAGFTSAVTHVFGISW
jgi:glycosyltransferase involved in cell wall biosynthesis